MRKIFYIIITSSAFILHGCTSDEYINSSLDNASTRAATVTVVWEAAPGTIDIPRGQDVTVTLDGRVIKQ